jgi:hypothetical protein
MYWEALLIRLYLNNYGWVMLTQIYQTFLN